MSLYAIGDLHLCFSCNKPMDIFGDVWKNYTIKIENEWNKIVNDSDTTVIVGDISWATYLSDALEDFRFIDKLKGRKIILKGNHDYWWTSITKIKKFVKNNNFETLEFLNNDCCIYEDIAICGTRGWNFPLDNGFSKDDEKIYKRELIRMEFSLKEAYKKEHKEIYFFMHFPPTNSEYIDTEFTNLMLKYDVKKCYFGHIHGEKVTDFASFQKKHIHFDIVSADALKFKPLLVKK